MIQIKNFLVITMMWAIGMVALTAVRATIQNAPQADSANSSTFAQQN
jgi:hypothetical protein